MQHLLDVELYLQHFDELEDDVHLDELDLHFDELLDEGHVEVELDELQVELELEGHVEDELDDSQVELELLELEQSEELELLEQLDESSLDEQLEDRYLCFRHLHSKSISKFIFRRGIFLNRCRIFFTFKNLCS